MRAAVASVNESSALIKKMFIVFLTKRTKMIYHFSGTLLMSLFLLPFTCISCVDSVTKATYPCGQMTAVKARSQGYFY